MDEYYNIYLCFDNTSILSTTVNNTSRLVITYVWILTPFLVLWQYKHTVNDCLQHFMPSGNIWMDTNTFPCALTIPWNIQSTTVCNTSRLVVVVTYGWMTIPETYCQRCLQHFTNMWMDTNTFLCFDNTSILSTTVYSTWRLVVTYGWILTPFLVLWQYKHTVNDCLQHLMPSGNIWMDTNTFPCALTIQTYCQRLFATLHV